MQNKTVAEATADLSHVVANTLLILENANKLGDAFMNLAEIGQYAVGKVPELRRALDGLKAAQVEAEWERINATNADRIESNTAAMESAPDDLDYSDAAWDK